MFEFGVTMYNRPILLKNPGVAWYLMKLSCRPFVPRNDPPSMWGISTWWSKLSTQRNSSDPANDEIKLTSLKHRWFRSPFALHCMQKPHENEPWWVMSHAGGCIISHESLVKYHPEKTKAWWIVDLFLCGPGQSPSLPRLVMQAAT